MPVRPVTGTIRTPTGEPWPEFTLDFTVTPSAYTLDAQYPYKSHEVTTGPDGTFSVDLVTGISYEVALTTAFDTTRSGTRYPPGTRFIVTVPEGEGPISLEELRALNEPPRTPGIIDIVDGKADRDHTHIIDDVEGLQDALADAGDTSAIEVDIAALQTGKADAGHTHDTGEVAGLDTALAGKADAGHDHQLGDVTGLSAALDAKADTPHVHTIGDVEGLQDALADAADTSMIEADIAALQTGKADAGHTHDTGEVAGLDTALAGKADLVHIHEIADVTGLQDALDAKADTPHVHTIDDVEGLQGALEDAANSGGGGTVTPVPAGTALNVQLTSGQHVPVVMPFDGQINAWTLIGDAAGSVEIGLWRTSYGDAPPTVSDSIVGGDGPALASGQVARGVGLTGWDAEFSEGDVLMVAAGSMTTLTTATLCLHILRTGAGDPWDPVDPTALYDTFTAADDTQLQVHTTGGLTWVPYSGSGDSFRIVNNRVYASGTSSGSRRAAYVNTDLPSADYEVEAAFTVLSDNDNHHIGISARVDPVNNNNYTLIYTTSGDKVRLYKMVGATTESFIAEYTPPVPPTSGTLKLRVEGSTLRGYLDDVEVITHADTDITDTGYPGIRSYGTSDVAVGVQFDDFRVTPL